MCTGRTAPLMLSLLVWAPIETAQTVNAATAGGVDECPAMPPCEHCKPDDVQFTPGATAPRDFIAADGTCKLRTLRGVCPVTCEAGFKPLEDWQTHWHRGAKARGILHRGFVCEDDLQWHGQDLAEQPHTVTCQPKEGWCDSNATTSDGVVLNDRDCKRRIGDECDATCADGFEWNGLGSNQYVCGADKKWTAVRNQHALGCERVCPRDPEPYASFRNGCNHAFGSQCEAQCDPGYNSTVLSMKYTCSVHLPNIEQSRWVPETHRLDCRLHGCADKVLAPHAEVCRSAPQHGTCKTECDVGYRYTGGSANFTCGSDGTWEAFGGRAALRCEAISDFCVGDPDEESGRIRIDPKQDCSRELGSTCKAECVPGTVPMPDTDLRYKCAKDDVVREHGKWVSATTRPLVCGALCSPNQQPSPHAKFTAGCTRAATTVGAVCVATCGAGYRWTSGIDTVDYTCNPESGEWTPLNKRAALVCTRDCAEGQEPNATDPTQCSECAPGWSSAGDKCVDCRQGVWLAGRCQQKSRSSIDQAQDWWHHQSQSAKLFEIILLLVATVGVVLVCCGLSRRQSRRGLQPADVLRESFLPVEKLPATTLTALDIPARWNKAASLKQVQHWPDVPGSSSSTGSSPQPTSSPSDAGSASFRRRAKDSDNVIHVMFSSEHVHELQPTEWMKQNLGSGSYGDVYKATWRGQEVAVKVVKLPERTLNPTAAAKARLQDKVEEIIFDFVSEVEVCADLNHPNLVRLLGYADKPRLMILQELCKGNSLDQQLYVEDWRPSHAQVLKVALDVAKGMEYLHTHYNAPDNQHTQPIIHRDLKSPNVLLVAPPADGQVTAKVTDFGLSRDKGLDQNFSQTAMMTGYCGSVLWMAPEILLGDTYNEKIDVYSYAMCLVELVSGKLPWSGVATGAKIPHKVTRAERPTKQLAGTVERPVDTQIAELIQDCWAQDAESRPDFCLVVRRLHDLARHQDMDPAMVSRVAGSDWSGTAIGAPQELGGAASEAGILFPVVEDDGVSRPASRSVSPELSTMVATSRE